MALVVQKFGGTSVASVERIQAVARRAVNAYHGGDQLVVVVSAMAGETDRLLRMAESLSPGPKERELDVLLATGEQASAALLAMAIEALDVPAISLLGDQIRIMTDSSFGRARIRSIDRDAVLRAIDDGHIVVAAGFQGVDQDGNITTLGRGGSDTTAVALAAALKADTCEIYTDVEGVYTSDPRICPTAFKRDRISYDEMLELASLGARVLQTRAVEFAKRYEVPLRVCSSFSPGEGTWVIREDPTMEAIVVAGVTCEKEQAKITLLRVPDHPGLAARIFGPIAASDISVDMIVQTGSADGTTDLTFTVHRRDYARALDLIRRSESEIGAAGVTSETGIAKVSIVGVGMRSHAGVAARMFDILAREGINIRMISTSEIKVSVAVDAKCAEQAVTALHDELIGPAQATPGSPVECK